MEDYVNKKDSNGWTPMHEGARSGHKNIIEVLVESGADINAKTNAGHTALWWSDHQNGEGSAVSQFLRSLGALKLGPEL